MKRFILAMLLGVGLATVGAVALARALLPDSTWQQSTGVAVEQVRQSQRGSAQPADSAEAPRFSQAEAIEVVAARLGSSPKADRLRQSLRSGAQVEYHSPGHWTVRLNGASWTAHGFGTRYAEPDNDAARLVEQQATGPFGE